MTREQCMKANILIGTLDRAQELLSKVKSERALFKIEIRDRANYNVMITIPGPGETGISDEDVQEIIAMIKGFLISRLDVIISNKKIDLENL